MDKENVVPKKIHAVVSLLCVEFGFKSFALCLEDTGRNQGTRKDLWGIMFKGVGITGSRQIKVVIWSMGAEIFKQGLQWDSGKKQDVKGKANPKEKL